MRQKGFEAEKTGNKGLEWQRESYEKTFRILGNKLARLQEEVAKQKHRLAELTKAGNAAETALRKVRELRKDAARRGLASAGRSAERERERLAGEKRLLEAFHRELLRKEQILMQRSEAVRASAIELKQREREAEKKLGSSLNRLGRINKQLIGAERKLEVVTGKSRQYEENAAGHVSHMKDLTIELKHLMRIRKELQMEVVSVEAVDDLIWRIGKLMMAGEVDRAVMAYESLRAAYGSLDRKLKRKLYPKLIGLHYSISEQARNNSESR